MNSTQKGAAVGSIVPGIGTGIGAAVGHMFGGGGGGAPFQSGLADETAYATQDFKEIFGRDPSPDELAMIVPAYVGTDQHIPNKAQGRAYVAQLFQTQENTPDKLYKKQQDQYAADAHNHYDAVRQLFQSNLERMPTQDELDHFGSLLSSGTTDPYQLQQFIQQQPEYTTTQDQKMRDLLSGQLSGYDKQYFTNDIFPSIQQAWAKQGRSFDSSAFQNSATMAAQSQNTQRQQFLAQLSAQQYGGRQQNAYQNYTNMVQNQLGLTNAGINAQYAGIQNNINRSNQFSDFNTQSQLYNQYIERYGKRNNGLGGLLGGLAGAGIGGFLSKSPQGAMAGYQIGQGVGQAGQNYYGGSY